MCYNNYYFNFFNIILITFFFKLYLTKSKNEKLKCKVSKGGIESDYCFCVVMKKDIFLAGTETSSAALQWAMAEMMNKEGVLKRVKEEIDEVVGTNRLVSESDITNLRYLQAVVKEVLRLHPTAPLAIRESAENCSINGYDIKGQTRTLINVYAIMRDPEAWPNPEEFMPERFLDGINAADFSYLPFGFGRRGCPGSSLALTLIQVTLASLIQCFQWNIKAGEKLCMEEASSFSTGLAKPLLCYPITRFNPF